MLRFRGKIYIGTPTRDVHIFKSKLETLTLKTRQDGKISLHKSNCLSYPKNHVGFEEKKESLDASN